MNKKWIITIVIVFFIVAGGIFTFTQLNNNSFHATITYVGEDFILVESDSDNHLGNYSISINQDTQILDANANAIFIVDLSEGDTIIVHYKGTIQESDPALISNCTKIELLE